MNIILSVESIINDIKGFMQETPEFIKKIGIFGSLARGDFDDSSDIDLLIEYNEPSEFSIDIFGDYCGLCNKIQDKLRQKYDRGVDIVHFDNDDISAVLNDPNVINEVIWV